MTNTIVQPPIQQSDTLDDPRAVIDIGSHSLLLLIASGPRVDPQILDEDYHITALGEGMSHTGVISNPAADRTLKALTSFIQKCQVFGVKSPLLIATGALRLADNKEAMLSFLSQQGRFKIQVLTEQQEARFARAGALSGLDLDEEATTLDLGGRSTEISSPSESVSLPIGCQGAAEIFFKNDPPLTDEIQKLRHMVRTQLPPTNSGQKPTTLICSGGTATTLAALDQKLRSYNSLLIHGHRISGHRLGDLVTNLVSSSLKRRTGFWKLEPQRALVLPAGAVILEEICLRHGAREIIISARGLNWGILMQWDWHINP